jgi:hypothetical protein
LLTYARYRGVTQKYCRPALMLRFPRDRDRALQLRRAALGIAYQVPMIVGTRPKLGQPATISATTLNMGANPPQLPGKNGLNMRVRSWNSDNLAKLSDS